jgi:hypothetical protein
MEVIMKSWRIVLFSLIAVLLVSTISVSAAEIEEAGATQPWRTTKIDGYGHWDVGTHVSMVRHPKTGKLYISYYDSVNTALKMAHEVTPGTGNCRDENWECETVQSGDSVGKYSSIDVVYIEYSNPILNHTKIGISFYDATKQRLRYATCNSGLLYTCEWQVYNVDDSSNEQVYVGQYSSLKFDSENVPHIAYHSYGIAPFFSSANFASYVGEGTGNCIDGGSFDCETIDSSSSTLGHGSHTSLDFNLYSGEPIVAFYNAEDDALEMAYPTLYPGSECSNTDWTCRIIDDDGNVGKYVSLHAPKSGYDTYRLAYYDVTNAEVKYAVYVGTGGNCTNPAFDCYAVDTVGAYTDTMNPISLAIDTSQEDDYPVIAYSQFATEGWTHLKIARPASSYGELFGNCGDVPPGELFLYWQCSIVDVGGPHVHEGYYVALDVNSAGLAAIAYSELYVDYSENSLMLARQQFQMYLPLIQR